MSRIIWLLVTGCVVLSTTAGCGKSNTCDVTLVPVSGTVTWQGKPVEDATVVFCPKSAAGRAAVGKTDAQGQFKLTTYDKDDGVVPSSYAITVTKTRTEGTVMTPEQTTDYYIRQGKQPSAPKVTQILPSQYADAARSGLSATIVPKGDNQCRIELR